MQHHKNDRLIVSDSLLTMVEDLMTVMEGSNDGLLCPKIALEHYIEDIGTVYKFGKINILSRYINSKYSPKHCCYALCQHNSLL